MVPNPILTNPAAVTLSVTQWNKEIQSVLGSDASTDPQFNLLLLIKVILKLWPRSGREEQGEHVEFNQGKRHLVNLIEVGKRNWLPLG